jgi:hypothetical protein
MQWLNSMQVRRVMQHVQLLLLLVRAALLAQLQPQQQGLQAHPLVAVPCVLLVTALQEQQQGLLRALRTHPQAAVPCVLLTSALQEQQ